jgi:8-oxo-dGTP diphosphatase
MRQIVNALLLHNGQILLARRGHERAAYPGLWSFPGGHVEEQETQVEALIRELREEIGIIPGESQLITSIQDANVTSDTATYHLYAVRRWEGIPAIQDQEHSELRWFALAEAVMLPDLALHEYRAVFLALLQSKSNGIGTL